MSEKKSTINNQRRHFLRNSILVSTGTVIASGGLHATETPEAKNKQPDQKDKGYRLTKHIQDYYKSAAS